MVFRDILMVYLTPLLRPPPLQYPKTAEALKNKHVIRDLKILFEWGALGYLDFFSLESRDLGL
jgi:hypothetical protein